MFLRIVLGMYLPLQVVARHRRLFPKTILWWGYPRHLMFSLCALWQAHLGSHSALWHIATPCLSLHGLTTASTLPLFSAGLIFLFISHLICTSSSSWLASILSDYLQHQLPQVSPHHPYQLLRALAHFTGAHHEATRTVRSRFQLYHTIYIGSQTSLSTCMLIYPLNL